MPNDAPRVLVLWADAKSANLGVRVLASGADHLLSSISDVVHVKHRDFVGDPGEVSFGLRSVLYDAIGVDRSLRKAVQGYDLVIDTGAGDSFADIYGLRRLAVVTYVQRRVHRAGTPLVFSPQTFGPFETRLGRHLARRSLRTAKLILARDSVSREVASRLANREVPLATDMVFLLPIPSGGPRADVIFNPSGLLWSSNGHVDSGMYRDNATELIRRLLAEGRKVTLMPHVLANESLDDDEIAVSELLRRFDGLIDVSVPDSVMHAREILAGARLVIGSRMHACLNALSVGTPAIAWAYSRKFHPLMTEIGWDAVIDLRSDEDPVGRTLELMEESSLWDRKMSTIRESADVKIATARELVALALTQVDDDPR